MDRNNAKKWLLAVLLCGIAACMLLGACGPSDSCVSGCSLLRSIWTPELGIAGEEKTPLPYIEGSLSAEEVSGQLASYYTPIAEIVEQANETMDIFFLEHQLMERSDRYYLHSNIVCSTGGEIALPGIYIPYAGEAQLPEWKLPDGVTGSEMICAWLELTANKVEFDSSRLDDEMTMPSVLQIYLDYYRGLSKREIDTSRFAESIDYDQVLREAMVLSLCENEYAYSSEYFDILTLVGVSGDLLSAVINDACGKGSEGFTERELLECISTFLEFGIVDGGEAWDTKSELIVRLVNDRLKELPENKSMMPVMSRLDVAETMVGMFEQMYGTCDTPDYITQWLSDTDDIECVKANYNGMMWNFPKGDQFSPGYIPGGHEMPEFASQFIESCVYENCWEDMDDTVTYADVMRALSAVDVCARSLGISKSEPVEVNNTRSYDWYYTQHNTGWYSSVNCMPTIAMMATRWYYPDTTVTIQEMRQRYLPEYNGGWFTWQVAECLTENGVPNEMIDVSEDILPYLDDGKIILTQMSEAEIGESGHCFIIYGYWKLDDTIVYYVHDPDVYDGIDEFGQRPGKAMVLDGRYCDWIIDRIAFSYIVVG